MDLPLILIPIIVPNLFTSPESFTLILGNEEYGLSDEWLEACDHIVTIPMYGFKNSLNVASAYSIAAYEIRRQHALKHR